MEPDLVDPLGGQPLAHGEVADRVDGRVDHHAARVWLDPVVEDLPPLTEAVHQVGGRAGRRHHGEHAATALERVGRAGESAGGKQTGPHACLGGMPGVERLRHGAELLAVTGGLGGGDAEAMRGGHSLEPEQPDRDRRRGQRAGGPGHVPARVVVLGVERIAGPGGQLVAEGVRGEQVDAPAAAPLRQRRARGVQRRGGMQNGGNVGVIEIQCMAGDSVDERGVGDSQPVGCAEHRGLRLSAEQKALFPGDASRQARRRPLWPGQGDRAGTGCSRAARRRALRRLACGKRSRAGSAFRRKSDRRSLLPCSLYNRISFRITDWSAPVTGDHSVSRALAAFAAEVRIERAPHRRGAPGGALPRRLDRLHHLRARRPRRERGSARGSVRSTAATGHARRRSSAPGSAPAVGLRGAGQRDRRARARLRRHVQPRPDDDPRQRSAVARHRGGG